MNRKPRMVQTGSAREVLCAIFAAMFAFGLLLAPAAAFAGQDQAQAPAKDAAKDPAKDKDDALDKAGKIVTQPVRDVGIEKTKVDPMLEKIAKQPYAPAGSCSAIAAELTRLNGALGPDFGADSKANEDKAEKLALAGGDALVSSLIPFRGLVREVSGAASADRRKAAAISAGTARRGYLRGVAVTKKCRAAR
jgi:hypothetical protein